MAGGGSEQHGSYTRRHTHATCHTHLSRVASEGKQTLRLVGGFAGGEAATSKRHSTRWRHHTLHDTIARGAYCTSFQTRACLPVPSLPHHTAPAPTHRIPGWRSATSMHGLVKHTLSHAVAGQRLRLTTRPLSISPTVITLVHSPAEPQSASCYRHDTTQGTNAK